MSAPLPYQTSATAFEAQPAPATLAGERRLQVPLREAAELLGISYWLAYKLAKQGELVTNRVGRNLYVPIEVLRAYARGFSQGGGVA